MKREEERDIEIDRLEGEVERLQDEISDLKTTISSLEADLEDAEWDRLRRLRAEYRDLEDDNSNLRSECIRLGDIVSSIRSAAEVPWMLDDDEIGRASCRERV